MAQLTRGELEIMDVVWQRGRATVQEVCDGLQRPLAYTTVMTVLKTLEIKRRVLRKVKEGRAFVYEPTVSRDDVCRSVASELKQHLARGSVKSLVLNLIEDEPISVDELAEIKRALARLEKQQ
jgi:predicted transcriptional regulator